MTMNDHAGDRIAPMLNRKAGVSAVMALENTGWGTGDHWMRMRGRIGRMLPRREEMSEFDG